MHSARVETRGSTASSARIVSDWTTSTFKPSAGPTEPSADRIFNNSSAPFRASERRRGYSSALPASRGERESMLPRSIPEWSF